MLALICGLVSAPHSLMGRLLSSPPLRLLADLSYATYLLHCSVITMYAFVFQKRWDAEYERLEAYQGAPHLDALDYAAVVLLSTALAYPVTVYVEPRVAAWVRSRVEAPAERALL